ncbi:unannotated protein [freshwater metagenome]|uniref:Unannotated protein n=1 Tax=freshwater metagenome TaxID=449393 RepID=A0A6J6L9E1_9ZZZZ
MRVVSAPPSRSSKHSEMISASVQRRPSTSVVAQIEMRSSCGEARRALINSIVAPENSMIALMESSEKGAVEPSAGFCPDSCIVTSDHSRSFGHSSRGNPSLSPIKIAGSGDARDSIASHDPFAATSSISSLTIERIFPSICLTARGVNCRATSIRCCWCSGSSRLIIDVSSR